MPQHVKVIIDNSLEGKHLISILSALKGFEDSNRAVIVEEKKLYNKDGEFDISLDICIPQKLIEANFSPLIEAVLTMPHEIFPIEYSYGSFIPELSAAFEDECGIVRDDYKFIQFLTLGKIKTVATQSLRHFAQSAGILLGGEASSLVNFDKVEVLPYSKSNAMFSDVPSEGIVLAIDFENAFDKTIKHVELRNFAQVDDYMAELQRARSATAVIGPPSFLTHAACCVGVPTIEIFDTQEELSILSKWSFKKYAAVLKKDIGDVTVQRVNKLVAYWNSLEKTVNEPIDVEPVADGL